MSLTLREYFWLAIILILAVAFVWDHYSGVRQGVARQVASDARTAQVAQKAVEAQKLTDAKTSADAVQGLQNELNRLRSKPEPVPISLCVSSPRRSVSSPAKPAGGAPSPAPASGELQPVPSGAGTGFDVGAGVRLITEAADVLAARDRACIAWARGIAR